MELIAETSKMTFVQKKPRSSRNPENVRAQLSHLSKEQQREACECMLVFCKPVELYRILDDRSKIHPLFLQRCLHYKLQEMPKTLVKPGNVTFYYKYYHDMLETTEVKEDYACPFCSAKCACYQGLKSHLMASHDLFRYEFVVQGGYEDVIVYAKTNTRTSDIFGKMVHPSKDQFFFCRKPMRRRDRQIANEVGPLALVPVVPSTLGGLRGDSELMDQEL